MKDTIDNTMHAEYSEASTKNIKSWGKVVKYKCTRDKDITYNVRFNPELYNITFKSGYDQDDYIIDRNSKIVKIINQTCKFLERIGIFTNLVGDDAWYDQYEEVSIYGDAPVYGAGYHFKFKDEVTAHVFTKIVNTLIAKVEKDDKRNN